MKLIEPDALSSVLRKIKGDKYRIINLHDAGSYYYKTDMQDILSRPHDLAEEKPGTGIYLLTEDESILEEARNWITEIEPEGDKYVITKKDYFVLRPKENLPKNLKKATRFIPKIYTDDSPMIYSVKPEDKDCEEGYLIDRFVIEQFQKNGLTLTDLESFIDVYTQRINRLEKRTLTDAIDIPRTIINHKNTPYNKARKIILTFTYNPVEGVPAFLENGEVCELEPVNMTDSGETIFKLSHKIITNMHNAEYLDRVIDKKNHPVILLDNNVPSEIKTVLERIYTDSPYDDVLELSPSKEYLKLCSRLGLEEALTKENIEYILGGPAGIALIKANIKELSEYPAGKEPLYVEKIPVQKTIPKMI